MRDFDDIVEAGIVSGMEKAAGLHTEQAGGGIAGGIGGGHLGYTIANKLYHAGPVGKAVGAGIGALAGTVLGRQVGAALDETLGGGDFRTEAGMMADQLNSRDAIKTAFVRKLTDKVVKGGKNLVTYGTTKPTLKQKIKHINKKAVKKYKADIKSGARQHITPEAVGLGAAAHQERIAKKMTEKLKAKAAKLPGKAAKPAGSPAKWKGVGEAGRKGTKPVGILESWAKAVNAKPKSMQAAYKQNLSKYDKLRSPGMKSPITKKAPKLQG